jgi:predicted  nucleic acid-binding Zn-ribbon protein
LAFGAPFTALSAIAVIPGEYLQPKIAMGGPPMASCFRFPPLTARVKRCFSSTGIDQLWERLPVRKTVFMVDETDTPTGGASEKGKEIPVSASGELTLDSTQSPSAPDEGHALPWLRMDPNLSRTVLAKTEEELLGTLSALMRNKVEHEKAQRSLAHTLLEIEAAKNEMAALQRQIRTAEDELNARLNDHGRTVDEIARVQFQLQEERTKYLQSQDELIALKREMEKTRGELSAATSQLVELNGQRDALHGELEQIRTELTSIEEKRRVVVDQLQPIANELDERLTAREAIIQEIAVLQRHVAELTERAERERDKAVSELGEVQENEPKSEPPIEAALPLLLNQPLPEVTPSWDSYRLESEFFTDETLDANRVVHLIAELPGIENVLVVRQRGAVLAGDMPPRISEQLKAPDRDYETLFQNWPNRVHEQVNGDTRTTIHQVGHEFLTSTHAEDLFLLVSHEAPKLRPGVEEKLTVVAEELAKMYCASANSR